MGMKPVDIRGLSVKELAGLVRKDPGRIPRHFEILMEDLRKQGFVIGVDHYLRVRALLSGFGGSGSLDRLKTLFCPVFAVNEKQQAVFYQTFDRIFPLAAEGPAPGAGKAERKAGLKEREKAGKEAQETKPISRWRVFLAAILWIVMIGMFAVQFQPRPEVVQPGKTEAEVPPEAVGGSPPQVERLPDKIITYPLNVRQPELTLYQRYGRGLRLASLLVPPILFLFWLIWLRYRQRLAAARRRGLGPPYQWPLRVEPPRPDFFGSKPFFGAATRLRERITGEAEVLDIPETLAATIDQAGFPSFRYRPVTRPPEYLMLIDLPDFDDHGAAFADAAAEALAAQGVFLERFFYVRDPRICFRKSDGVRMRLWDLQGRYGRHRLILVGNGDGLIDPETGRIAAWARGFEAWADRALLTHVPPKEWSMRELILAGEFILLPAAIDGMAALVDHLESQNRPGLRPWIDADHTPRLPRREPDDPDALRRYLGDAGFRWLCACAVYPELNWGLTLHVGAMVNAVTEENLLKMIRLPWFRRGGLPEELRMKLIDCMEAGELAKVQESICEALENDPPPEGSAAWDHYQLSLAVHKWMVAKRFRKRLAIWKAAREQMGRLGRERVLKDPVMLQVMAGSRMSPLAFQLPRKMERLFFRKGFPLLGFRMVLPLLLVLMLCFGILWWVPKPEPPVAVAGEKLRFRFAHIPDGWFMMGSGKGEPGADSDEFPQHRVKISKDFYLQTTEVTQGQWKAVMGENPARFKDCGDDCPVEQVSWEDTQRFIEQLNELEKKKVYRLPTEAEWEYAARAGTTTPFAFGDCLSTDVANYDGNYPLERCPEGEYRNTTIPVGSLKKANDWGLYDMHGNVWEWCQDWFDSGYYANSPEEDPQGPDTGGFRVVRGGSWFGNAAYCRSAGRLRFTPGFRAGLLGFRLLRSSP